MEIESCRDCANFEDRRDKEGVALCAMHHGPSVCCQEFKPKNGRVNPDNVNDRFCLNCANYDEIGEVPVCARDHRPGRACGAFRSRIENLAAALEYIRC
jgi:hypothetical protein